MPTHSVVIGLLSLVLLGCGGQKKPELSESRNFLVEARRAIGSGDLAKALEALDASIKSEPSLWAHLDRAKIHATSGNDDSARADCKAVLGFDPENRDIPWIQKELKKSVDKRFQGRFASSPSSSK